ncbi:YybH family protein [Aeoliella sp.]|uniref:YybH family protein n=1 Tax=Aeoliella sp. TaxID=2795800 RepID=UPI003CCBB3E4
MVVRILLAFALVACCVAATIADETSAESKDDSKIESVREANTKFYAALNSMFTGELQPMSEVWSHSADVTYLGPDGSFRQGWKETLADWQKQAEMKLGGKVEPQNVRITVGSELAVVHNYEVGRNTVDGKETKVKIRATNVYRKEDGQWKMIGHHTDLLKFLEE